MKIKSALLAPLFAAAVVFTGASASAATYQSFLEYTEVGAFATAAGMPNNNTSNTPPYYGKVVLTEGGSGNSAYVDVNVELYFDFKFVNTGNDGNHTPFTWNIHDPSPSSTFGVTVAPSTNMASLWHLNNPLITDQPPFGSFNYGLNCCDNGGRNAIYGPLNFRVTSTNGITMLGVGGYTDNTGVHFGAGDRFTSNFGGWWFAVDAWAPGGATGVIAARDLVIFTAVPEPETYAMLFAGLGLMGFVAARRRKKVSP